MNANQRTALYGLAGTVVALLSAYGVLTTEQAGAVLAVAGGLIGVFAAFTAIRNVTPDVPVIPAGDDDES